MMSYIETIDQLRREGMNLTRVDLRLDGKAGLSELSDALRFNASLREVLISFKDSVGSNQLVKPACHSREEILGLLSTIAGMPSLKKITLAAPSTIGFSVDIQILTVTLFLARQLTKLAARSMNFRGNTNDYGLLAMAFHQHPSLRELSLHGSLLLTGNNPIKLDVVSAIATIPTLTTIDINGLGVLSSPDEASLRALCSSQSLERMLFLDFDLSEDDVVTIANTIAHPNNTSSNLMDYCDDNSHRSGRKCVDDVDDDDVVQYPPNDVVLRELTLSAFELGKKSSNALRNPPNDVVLRELTLSAFELGKKSSNALRNMLQLNLSLHKVSLWVKDVEQDDWNIGLAKALRTSTVARFELGGWGEMSRKSLKAFVAELPENYYLEHLSLPYGKRNTDLAKQAEFYLKLNRVGRWHIVQNNDMKREKYVEVLCKVRNDLDCLYYFLSINPCLMDPSSMNLPSQSQRRSKTSKKKSEKHGIVSSKQRVPEKSKTKKGSEKRMTADKRSGRGKEAPKGRTGSEKSKTVDKRSERGREEAPKGRTGSEKSKTVDKRSGRGKESPKGILLQRPSKELGKLSPSTLVDKKKKKKRKNSSSSSTTTTTTTSNLFSGWSARGKETQKGVLVQSPLTRIGKRVSFKSC